MNPPRETPGREQQLLRHARREGWVILAAWATALVWSHAVCYLFGYRRPAAALGFILGIPDWVFWGVVAPWALCLAFSVWFCFRFMADDDLGKDPDEGADHA
jgi:hypothetical protein